MKIDMDEPMKLSEHATMLRKNLYYWSDNIGYIDRYTSYTEMTTPISTSAEYPIEVSYYKYTKLDKLSDFSCIKKPSTNYFDKYNFYHGNLNSTYIEEVYRKILRLNKR